MKVGIRKQQGRTDGNRTGVKIREVCPCCNAYYLKSFFIYECNKWVKMGKVCSNKNCTFSRKD